MPWFQKRREAAEQDQRRLWRQARISTDIQKLISKMSELEIVDCFNAIETHLLAEIQVALFSQMCGSIFILRMVRTYFVYLLYM